MKSGEDHTTVPLSSDHRTFVAYRSGNVGFTDRGSYEPGAEVTRRVFHYQTGRQIHDHNQRATIGVPRPREHGPDSQRQRVVFPDRIALLVHQGEPVDIRVHREAEIRAALAHQVAQIAQVFRNGFGRMRKPSIWLEVNAAYAHAEAFKQRRERDTAGSPYT